MTPTSECILVFLRAPDRGKVKKRLARALGDDAALALYRCFVADLLAVVAESGRPAWLCYTPPGGRERIKDWLGDTLPMLPQQGGDLGRRMAHAFRTAFFRGVGRALLVGTDIPDLPRTHIAQAFAGLDSRSSVIGPTLDGGYYLIGFRSDGFAESVFDGIPWGTDRVMAETLAAFERENRTPLLLESWPDIDRRRDLAAFMARQGKTPWAAPATSAFLAERFPGGLPAEPKRPVGQKAPAGAGEID